MTCLNIDGVWFHESELNFVLLLEVFCVFPDITGDIGDPGSIAKARLGSRVTEGSSSRPSRLKDKGRLGTE